VGQLCNGDPMVFLVVTHEFYSIAFKHFPRVENDAIPIDHLRIVIDGSEYGVGKLFWADRGNRCVFIHCVSLHATERSPCNTD
jgi:hypothetical protein